MAAKKQNPLVAVVASILILGFLLGACGDKKKGDELTLLGLASVAAASSSCAGGVPEVQLVNSSTQSANVYIVYEGTNCTGTTLATTAAISVGSAGEPICVSGTTVGIKDKNGTGNCQQMTLFSGAKQTITHTRDGSTDSYNVVKTSSFLGFGGV